MVIQGEEMTFKDFMWKIGLRKKCPRCGSEILEVGYPKDFVQYYKCANPKCMWGKK